MDDPWRCLECGRIIIHKSVGLYFCCEDCQEIFNIKQQNETDYD